MEIATGLALVAQMVKNANAGGVRDVGLIPGSGRAPGWGTDITCHRRGWKKK